MYTFSQNYPAQRLKEGKAGKLKNQIQAWPQLGMQLGRPGPAGKPQIDRTVSLVLVFVLPVCDLGYLAVDVSDTQIQTRSAHRLIFL